MLKLSNLFIATYKFEIQRHFLFYVHSNLKFLSFYFSKLKPFFNIMIEAQYKDTDLTIREERFVEFFEFS